jgi:hypothetical protein
LNHTVSDAVKLRGCHYNVLMTVVSKCVSVIEMGLMTVVSKCVGVIEMGLMTVVSVWVSLKWGL